jgi:hypothetical protein
VRWVWATAGVLAFLGSTPGRALDALAMVAGTPLELSCDTKSVVVAPEAKTTTGTVRLRLELKASSTGDGSLTGAWAIIETTPAHTASFAAQQAIACKDGCPLTATAPAGPDKPMRIELWAPRRAAIDGISPNVPLTVAALDTGARTLRVSTFLDKQIAALEQGECK